MHSGNARYSFPNFGQIFLLALLTIGCAFAQADPASQQQDIEPVTFAIADVWPWGYEDEYGDLHGSLVDVMNRLSELAGVPVDPRIRPVRRAIDEIESGEVNFTILFKNPALEANAISIAPVVRVNIMLAALAGTDYPLTLEALKGEPVSFIRGTYLGEAFEKDTGVVREPVALISQAVELLSLGRISAILASEHALFRTIQAMDLRLDILRYQKHVRGQLGVLYMSRKAQRPDIAERFRDAIEQMEESNELSMIFFGRPDRSVYDAQDDQSAQ